MNARSRTSLRLLPVEYSRNRRPRPSSARSASCSTSSRPTPPRRPAAVVTHPLGGRADGLVQAVQELDDARGPGRDERVGLAEGLVQEAAAAPLADAAGEADRDQPARGDAGPALRDAEFGHDLVQGRRL